MSWFAKLNISQSTYHLRYEMSLLTSVSSLLSRSSVPGILTRMSDAEVEFEASSAAEGAPASAVRITEERYEEEGSYVGGGWCADVSDGTDETWKATFAVSHTVYAVAVKVKYFTHYRLMVYL